MKLETAFTGTETSLSLWHKNKQIDVTEIDYSISASGIDIHSIEATAYDFRTDIDEPYTFSKAEILELETVLSDNLDWDEYIESQEPEYFTSGDRDGSCY